MLSHTEGIDKCHVFLYRIYMAAHNWKPYCHVVNGRPAAKVDWKRIKKKFIRLTCATNNRTRRSSNYIMAATLDRTQFKAGKELSR